MNGIKRWVAGCLFCVMAVSFIPSAVYADSMDYTEKVIPVTDGKTTKDYTCLCTKDGDIYFAAEDLGEITGYDTQEGNGKVCFTLGLKLIFLETNTGLMRIDALNYEAFIRKPIFADGRTYLSGADLLPWMNVSCGTADGALLILPDSASFWTAAKDSFSGFNLFDINKVSDDSFLDMLGFAARITLDNVLGGRISRLIYDLNGVNLYDKETYIAALLDMAGEEETFLNMLEEAEENALSYNSTIGDLEEAFGFDWKEAELDAVNLSYEMSGMGIDQDTVDSFSELYRNWSNIREMADIYSDYVKYFEIFKMAKAYELIVHAGTDYKKLLNWIEENPVDDKTMNAAVKEVNIKLDETWGLFITYASEAGSDLMEDVLDGIKAKAGSGASANGLAGNMSLYLDLAGLFYSCGINITDACEETGKLQAYMQIMEDARRLCLRLESREMTKENLLLLREAYILALKASRKCYKAIEECFSLEVLTFNVYDGEGTMDYAVKPIDECISRLMLTADNGLHDSVEGKEEMRSSLLLIFGSFSGQPDYIGEENEAKLVRTLYLPDFGSLSAYQLYEEVISGLSCSNFTLVDLTHNGIPEMLALKQNENGRFDVLVYDCTGQLIYSTCVGGSHADEHDLYLCCTDGEWYFLCRNVGAGTGYTWDSFIVYYLRTDGCEQTLHENEGFCYLYEEEELPEAESCRYFADLNRYLEKSLLVLGTVAETGTEL